MAKGTSGRNLCRCLTSRGADSSGLRIGWHQQWIIVAVGLAGWSAADASVVGSLAEGVATPRLERVHVSSGQLTHSSSVFDVTSFGAKGDGETDDTRALRKAYAACATAGGGTVLFPEGRTFRTVRCKRGYRRCTSGCRSLDHSRKLILLPTCSQVISSLRRTHAGHAA